MHSVLEEMVADIAQLTDWIAPEARALGFDLVRVAFFGGDEPTLQVMAERPDTRQLTIDDCSALSHRLSDLFDALEADGRDPFDDAYRLEVSSPGIDRPLTRAKDFADWAGHEARIELLEPIAGQKRFRGVLQGLDPKGEVITLTDREGVHHALRFDQIDSAKLILTDRLIAATRPLVADGVDDIETFETED